MKGKILLIDGSSLIFRAFFAIRNLTTRDGISTNGVYGFLNMYRKALETVNPEYVCVAFDKSGPTFRNKDYEAYKANRDKTPPELSHQFGILKDILDSMNVKHIDMDKYEADDILGTISRLATKEGLEVYMLTGDRDYFQLVEDRAKVLYTKKGISELEIYDKDKIFERYGVRPKDLIEVKGLMGDTSDNIPGVPGIGEKTALKLIKEYGNIENIYKNLESLKGKKLKENLSEYKMQAYLSRKLGRIFTSVPLEYDLEDFKIVEANREQLYEKFKRLEFTSLMDEYADIQEQDYSQIEGRIKITRDVDGFIKKIKNTKNLIWNIYLDSDTYISGQIGYIAIKGDGDSLLLAKMGDRSREFFDKFRKFFENDKIRKLSFDIKKSFYIFEKYAIHIKNNYQDLLLALYLLDPSRSSYNISDLAKDFLDKDIKDEVDYIGKGKSRRLYDDLGEDLDQLVLNQIAAIEKTDKILHEKLAEVEMIDLYESIELPLIRVLADMEIEGFQVEKAELERQNKIISKKLDELEIKIHKLSDSDFNINSPKQLGEILFEKMGLPIIKKTKTGYSTDAEVLEKLKNTHEIIAYIIEYRALKKLKSTYIDGLEPYIGKDGRIHTIFRQTVTATGRISSIEPNLQNIPIRTEEGKLIRKAFVSGQDSVLVSADYSQIELRVLAALSMEENMIHAFENGIDIHKKTASEVFHVGIEDVSSKQRYEAKAVNFGIVYGISDYGLSRDLDIGRKVAKEYIEKYLNSYPSIKTYMDNVVQDAKDKGFVETLFKRRRYVPELGSKNFNIRSFGERIALNTPIQGTAADIIKLAMIKVYDRIKKEKLKSRLILQIHDELIIETKREELEDIEKILREEMESAVSLPVKLIVDIDEGESWYDI